MRYQNVRHRESESDDNLVWVAAQELYPLFYPMQSMDVPLAARTAGSRLFYKRVVARILEESGLLYGEVDHFAIAIAIHEISCPNEAKVVRFDDLSPWRRGVYLGWAQRVADKVIGEHYDA